MLLSTALGTKKLVGLPFTPHCNPLAENNEGLTLLIKSILEYQNEIKVSSLEIRTKKTDHDYSNFSLRSDRYFMTHILHLDSNLQEIRPSFHKSSTQRPLRKSEKK